MQVLKVDYSAENASSLFAQSLKETGFAVVKNHPISADLIAEVYAEWRRFFASEDKQRYLFGEGQDGCQDGYFPYQSENAKYTAVKDLKEFFHYYDWGQYPDSLSDRTRELYRQLT